MDLLLSLDETAFDMALLRDNANLLVVGAAPFRTFAALYNRRFGYEKVERVNGGNMAPGKRMKRFVEVFVLLCCL